MKPNFKIETCISVLIKQAGKCYNCGTPNIDDYHHIIANTKMNRKIYGEQIQSEENCVGVCRKCHSEHSFWDKQLRKKLEKDFKSKSKIK